MGKVNQDERAMHAWDVLAEVAAKRSTITYTDLAARVGAPHPMVCSYFLGLIQTYCLENLLPPLTILAVSKTKKKPGKGFVAHDMDELESGFESVWNFNWMHDGNPFDFTEAGETFKSLKYSLLSEPESAESVAKIVKNRGMRQVLFRAAVLEAYGERCAITKIAHTDLLEACHIIPWSQCTPAQQVDVRNGILMNRLHHAMFDRGYLVIDEKYKVHIYEHKSRDWGRDQVRHAIAKDLDGTKLHLPEDASLKPSQECLAVHRETWC